MPGLPDGFTLRPPVDGDGEPIARMLNEETIALTGAPLATVEWVTTPWTTPGADRAHDFAVVVDPEGNPAAYLSLESDPPYTAIQLIGAVGLPHHGRGIGAFLLAEGERRAGRFEALAPPGAPVFLRPGVLAGEPRVARLLTDHGYVEVRQFVRMVIAFDGPPPAPAPIPGIEIRPAVRGDELAVHACLGDTFIDHWGETWPRADAWLHAHAGPDADLDLWQLAWDGAELAGALMGIPRSYEDPALGHVAELGVRRAYRRRGIGQALLRTSFGQFFARGAAGVDLGVDAESLTGATRLYERVGMRAEPRFATWEKKLRPAGP
jgi:ribosomal protein S18 acetylase RimI-like enzyme